MKIGVPKEIKKNEHRIGLTPTAVECLAAIDKTMQKTLQKLIEARYPIYREADVTIEPFDLKQPVKYDVVIDRLTHWLHTSREWIKKGIVMNDLYVFNNPWSVQSNEKHTSYAAMMRLGMPCLKSSSHELG